MYAKSFEDRLDRLQRQPGGAPTEELIDSIIGPRRPATGVLPGLAGGICGTATGLAMKSLQMGGAGLYAEGSLVAEAVATAVPPAFLASCVLAIAAGFMHRRRPKLLQFAGMNLLVIAAAVLS